MAATHDSSQQNGSPTSNGHNHANALNGVKNHDLVHKDIEDTQHFQRAPKRSDHNALSPSKELSALYSPAVAAKVWAIASKALTMVREIVSAKRIN